MRKACVTRKTKETDISLELCLDGGEIEVITGIGFFDHMLTSFATHGGFGLKIKVNGDLEVDAHHTVEDTGITLGKAFSDALEDKGGILRFASFHVPMDEALAFAAVDVSGRAYLVFDAEFPQEMCGDYDACLTWEFMRAFAFNAGITLHIKSVYGNNSHHITEAIYKACAHALRIACCKTGNNIPLSTKGTLS